MPHDLHGNARSKQDLIAAHLPAEIRHRLGAGPEQRYVKDVVYGAIDGAVTTFAVVSGVVGAGLSPGIILILGGANLVGDGFSMAAGNFLGTRAEAQLAARLRSLEQRHITDHPEGEREEVAQILATQGLSGPILTDVVDTITSDKERWIRLMLQGEYGLSESRLNPVRAAFATFVSFLLAGSVPLLPFLLGLFSIQHGAWTYSLSVTLTALTFFGVGAVKSRFVEQHWIVAGLETLGVGGLAAGLSFLVGKLLAGLAA